MEHYGWYVREGIYAAIGESLCNTSGIAELSDLEHNGLCLQDMIPLLELLSTLMDLGVHEHMFCSRLQFKT